MKKLRITLLPLLMAFSDVRTEDRPSYLLLQEAFRCQIEGKLDCAEIKYREVLGMGGESAYIRSEFAKVLHSSGNKGAALEEAKRAIEINPGSADYHILYARLLNDTGNKKEAILHLKKSLQRFPNHPLMEFYLAEFNYESGALNEAIIIYSSVLFRLDGPGSQDPSYRNIVLWRLSEIYLKRNDPDRSRLYLLRYIKANPDHLYARFILGLYIHFSSGDYEGAKREFEFLHRSDKKTLIKQGIDPDMIALVLGQIYFLYDNLRCRSLLGDLYMLKKENLIRGLYLACEGDHENAARALLPEWKKNRNNFILSVAILRILLAGEWRDETAQEILRVSSLAKNPGQHKIMIPVIRLAIQKTEEKESAVKIGRFWERLSHHYENSGNHNRAALYLRRSIKLMERGSVNETDQRLRLAALLSEHDVRRYDEAEAICSEILEREQKNPDALFGRALVRIKKRSFQEAVEDLNEALRINGSSIPYYFYRAIAFREMASQEEAENDLIKILELEPDFPEALNFLGYLYAERGVHLDRALELIGKAVEESPVNGGYQDSLGWVYYRMGRFDEAIHHLELAVLLLREFDEEDPVVFDHLGDAYRSINRHLKAAAAYRQAINLIEKKVEGSEPRDAVADGKMERLGESIRGKLKSMGPEQGD